MEDLFDYYSRVDFTKFEIEDVLNKIIKVYNFSPLKTFRVIERGYEDFNVYVQTVKKDYVIKFFSKERTMKNILHYAKVIELLSNNKLLSIPKIYKTKRNVLGHVEHNGKDIYFFVMDYIDGNTVFELDKNMSLKTIIEIVFDVLTYNFANKELKTYLMSDMAKEFKPYDVWSYENFLEEYKDKKKYLSTEDAKLIEPVAEYYRKMKKRYERYDEIFKDKPVLPPYISTHNDFISTNIILENNTKPYYIDFSVSSISLNFVDVAVFGCESILRKDMKPEEYAKYLKIISYILYRTHIMEYNLYPSAVSVQHAIHLLIANYLKVCENVDSKENDYWMNSGRLGIKYIQKVGLLNKPVFNWVQRGDWYERSELGEISEYSLIKKEIKDLGLEDLVESKIKQYLKLYNKNKVDDQYASVELDDLFHNGYDWLYSCIDNVKTRETIMAISFCNDNEWNGEKVENLWVKLNIEALNRGVIMKRIFVYPDGRKNLVTGNKDVSKFIAYKKDNLELGFISDSKIREVLKEEFGKIFPGIVVFNTDVAFMDIVGDPDNRGYNVFDKKKIREFYQIYDIIKASCDR